MKKQLHGVRIEFYLRGEPRHMCIVAYTKTEAAKMLKDFLIIQKGYSPEDIIIDLMKFNKGCNPERITEEYYQRELNAVYKGVK